MTHPLLKFISKICVQTAVYWGSPSNDGYGTMTYAEPVEILVRWDDVNELIATADGIQYTSKAKILVQQDVDREGYLYLGALSGLTTEQKADPKLVDGAHRIVKVEKTPMIFETDVFVRTVWL